MRLMILFISALISPFSSHCEVFSRFAAGVLTINTTISDPVSIKCENGQLTLNNTKNIRKCLSITSIVIYGDPGANTFRFSIDTSLKNSWRMLNSLTVLGGNGTDKLFITYTQDSPPIFAPIAITFDGAEGLDSFELTATKFVDKISSANNRLRWQIIKAASVYEIATISLANLESVIFSVGAGNDIVDLSALTSSWPVRIYGGSGHDTLTGGLGRDTIYGGIGRDSLYGQANKDTLYGENGADRLYGGDGNDTLVGASGNDLLYGQADADILKGDAGNDIIYAGSGDDKLFGADGSDSLFGDDGEDLLDGGDGDDTLEGGLGDDELRGQKGSDSLNGGLGFDFLVAGSGSDTCIDGQVLGSCETTSYQLEESFDELPEEQS